MAKINEICQKMLLLNFLYLVIAIILIPISVNCTKAQNRVSDQNYRQNDRQQDLVQRNANRNAKPKPQKSIEDEINTSKVPFNQKISSQIARMFFEPVELDIKIKQAAETYKEGLLAELKPAAKKEHPFVKMTGLRCARQNGNNKFIGSIYNV